MELTITEENFDKEVLQSPLPVMIDFWAEWCGPCKVLSPIIEELAKDYEGKVKVGKVDVDDQGALSMRYNIMSFPTVKFFKGGRQVGELIGAAPKATVEAELKKHL